MTLSQSGHHVTCSAPRRRWGVPPNSLDYFDFESAPFGRRGEGEDKARDRRVPGRFPVGRGERRRDLPCEAVAKTARRSKKTHYTLIYRYEYVCVPAFYLLLQSYVGRSFHLVLAPLPQARPGREPRILCAAVPGTCYLVPVHNLHQNQRLFVVAEYVHVKYDTNKAVRGTYYSQYATAVKNLLFWLRRLAAYCDVNAERRLLKTLI